MKIIFCFILITIFNTIFFGCSPSLGTLRYSEKESDKQEDENVRFTSEDDLMVTEDEYTEIDQDSLFTRDDLYNPETDEDEMPEDDQVIDISDLFIKYGSSGNNTDPSADQGTIKEKMLMEIIKYLNTPYKYGGTSSNGIDCSAFTQTIYNETFSLALLRSARDQFTMGTQVANREDLKFGDLVFFNTRRRVRPGHVGIYIGDNLFAHASTKNGVIVSSLDHQYYSKRFMGGRRLDTGNLF